MKKKWLGLALLTVIPVLSQSDRVILRAWLRTRPGAVIGGAELGTTFLAR
jgi:hypothetical protein